ncbi:DUF4352 domain-containing protein [Nocardia sp. NBC_01388]|uniref:DUF4352 domain-containing protein n=1 Tax=Nocardia sp. NBC_01388 TaxID=2903596 RepID=UPI00324905F7
MTYQSGPQPYPQGPNLPPYQYPAAPPPRKSNAFKIILVVIVGIIALCGIGGALTGKSSKNSQSTSTPFVTTPAAVQSPVATQPPAPAPVTAGLNTPVRDGKFEFVVTEIHSGVKTLGDNQFLRKTAQGAYSIVSITVTNTSDKPYGFSPSSQYVFDAKNRKFSNDGAAAMNLQADTSLYADLNPGNTITAQVVFDLPTDSTPDHIVLHDSMFSGGATVSLR